MEKTANDCHFQNSETINRTRRTLPAVPAAYGLTKKPLEAVELVKMTLGKTKQIVYKGSEVWPKRWTSVRGKTMFVFQQRMDRFFFFLLTAKDSRALKTKQTKELPGSILFWLPLNFFYVAAVEGP